MATEKTEPLPLERQSGSNVTAIKRDLLKAKNQVLDINRRIKELQAEKQHVRDGVEAMGVPKKAFDHAIRVAEMDPDKRRAYDFGYEITREAVNAQLDLFTPADEEREANPRNKPKESSAVKPAAKKAAPKAAKPKAEPKPKAPAKKAAKPKEEKPAVDLSKTEALGSA